MSWQTFFGWVRKSRSMWSTIDGKRWKPKQMENDGRCESVDSEVQSCSGRGRARMATNRRWRKRWAARRVVTKLAWTGGMFWPCVWTDAWCDSSRRWKRSCSQANDEPRMKSGHRRDFRIMSNASGWRLFLYFRYLVVTRKDAFGKRERERKTGKFGRNK